jgi:hypothetical protein
MISPAGLTRTAVLKWRPSGVALGFLGKTFQVVWVGAFEPNIDEGSPAGPSEITQGLLFLRQTDFCLPLTIFKTATYFRKIKCIEASKDAPLDILAP